MSADITDSYSNLPVAEALRHIAAAIDDGKFEGAEATLIMDGEVFHMGTVDDERAAEQAVFNMTYGIHKLMYMAVADE